MKTLLLASVVALSVFATNSLSAKDCQRSSRTIRYRSTSASCPKTRTYYAGPAVRVQGATKPKLTNETPFRKAQRVPENKSATNPGESIADFAKIETPEQLQAALRRILDDFVAKLAPIQRSADALSKELSRGRLSIEDVLRNYKRQAELRGRSEELFAETRKKLDALLKRQSGLDAEFKQELKDFELAQAMLDSASNILANDPIELVKRGLTKSNLESLAQNWEEKFRSRLRPLSAMPQPQRTQFFESVKRNSGIDLLASEVAKFGAANPYTRGISESAETRQARRSSDAGKAALGDLETDAQLHSLASDVELNAEKLNELQAQLEGWSANLEEFQSDQEANAVAFQQAEKRIDETNKETKGVFAALTSDTVRALDRAREEANRKRRELEAKQARDEAARRKLDATPKRPRGPYKVYIKTGYGRLHRGRQQTQTSVLKTTSNLQEALELARKYKNLALDAWVTDQYGNRVNR